MITQKSEELTSNVCEHRQGLVALLRSTSVGKTNFGIIQYELTMKTTPQLGKAYLVCQFQGADDNFIRGLPRQT